MEPLLITLWKQAAPPSTRKRVELGGGGFIIGPWWAESSWKNRSSKVSKLLRFCDPYDRSEIPATEGDVLAYIGFISLAGRFSWKSIPQYLSDFYRYHVLQHLTSPTKIQLVGELVKSYDRKDEAKKCGSQFSIGISASVAHRIVLLGLTSNDHIDFG